jgi:hypothetical protein
MLSTASIFTPILKTVIFLYFIFLIMGQGAVWLRVTEAHVKAAIIAGIATGVRVFLLFVPDLQPELNSFNDFLFVMGELFVFVFIIKFVYKCGWKDVFKLEGVFFVALAGATGFAELKW